jgi:hypothetical protein
MDILGEVVVPVLRKEFAALRPAHVPDGPPLHPAVIARSSQATQAPTDDPAAVEAVPA